jgi:Raf kinase inhibitor-like YbhB/YbcL family protein
MRLKYFVLAVFIILVVFVAVFIIVHYTWRGYPALKPIIPGPIEDVVSGVPALIHVYSSSFSNGSKIPVKYVYCGGENISPSLVIEDVPANAISVVLIVYDPDAPSGVFYHWVVYGLRGVKIELSENASKNTSLLQGLNSYGFIGYSGPCPPQGGGEHRYVFLALALDIDTSNWPNGLTPERVLSDIKGHVIAYGYTYGVYSR